MKHKVKPAAKIKTHASVEEVILNISMF